MGSKPSGLLWLLLLQLSQTILLLLRESSGEEPSYTIDHIGITIQPGSVVESGTRVAMHCQVSVSSSSIPILGYHFQFTKDETLIHSFNTTGDSAVYELNPARAGDSGSYECRVTVKGKSKASVSQKLDVYGLQTPTMYLNNSSPFENEMIEATCSAPGEKGLFTFRFYVKFRSEEPRIVKQLQTQANSITTTLKLQHIGDCHLHCNYEISLLSGNTRSNSSNETQVIVRALNITPIINVLPSHSIFEGDVVEVICKVVGISLKNMEVFLTKNKRVLKTASSNVLRHLFTVHEGDSGELVCKAEWGNVQKENYLTITVKELFSRPQVVLEPIDLFEGDKFKLTCWVSYVNPERINNESLIYSFYKDGNKVTSSKSYINVAHPEKNGNYTCTANISIVGRKFVKESPVLTVRAKVPVSTPELSVVGNTLLLGKSFQLLCHSDRGTLPITYTLYSPDKLKQVKVVTRPRDKAIFTCPAILKSSELDNFLCHASNRKNKSPERGTGQQLLYKTNIIEPVSKPKLTVVPGPGEITEGHSINLICSVEKGSFPINFTWFHSEKQGSLHSLSTNKMRESYRISNVKGEHAGKYYCISRNQAKDNKQSDVITVEVKLAGWKKGLIGVFCILILLPLILVIAFKARLAPCRRKSTGRLSVKSASTKAERLSLTQAEVNGAANVTPGIMGKSVWSEHVSGSESDDQNSTVTMENPEPQYTEVQTREPDPNTVPIKQGTDTVYSEVRNSQQDAPEPTSTVSVEYAELNHDKSHSIDNSNQEECGANDGDTGDGSTCVSSDTAE